MTNSPSCPDGEPADPNFLAYRHLCVVLATPGFSDGERAAVTAAVADELPGFLRHGVDLERIEAPGRSRGDWAGLCFAPGTGREAEDTLVLVYSRRGTHIMLDLHRGANCMPDREPDPGTSAAGLITALLRLLRDFLDHPAPELPIRGDMGDSSH